MKVSEVLRLLAEEGWYVIETRGSHRQFKHLSHPGASQSSRQRDSRLAEAMDIVRQRQRKDECWSLEYTYIGTTHFQREAPSTRVVDRALPASRIRFP